MNPKEARQLGERRDLPAADWSGVDAVLARMREIAEELDKSDGVARFNAMYLAVTAAVREELARGRFDDPLYLSRLAAIFARLYLDAYDADRSGTPVPPAWAPLFEARSRPRIAAVQFALAGMNAHINRDLGVAVVAACTELDCEPKVGSPQHRDYLAMNDVLARVSDRVRRELLKGLLGVADAALGRVDDVISMWSVARARDAAWVHAETLWTLRGIPPLRDRYLGTLDRLVGLAGRGLLVQTL